MALRNLARPVIVPAVLLALLLTGEPTAPLPPSAASLAAQVTPASSLPSVASGARPGPDVLYAPPPRAPQLENRDPRFRAAPLLVMGHEAYVDGEYLYQDWIYDDNGSDSGANDGGGNETAGDISYPTDTARYGGNAADLVEVRIAPGTASVAYRLTLSTLLAADSSIITLAFDADANPATGRATLPRDPGFAFPGTDEVITTWGTGAEHSRLSTAGPTVTTPVEVRADLEANQLTVTVPRSVSDPRGTWRATVGAGLFDRVTGGWLRPGLVADLTTPGGAGPSDPQPSGIFNLGFRFDETPVGINPHDVKQAAAIRQKAPGAYQRAIDFGVLDRHESRTTVKATGTSSRIFASRLTFGEGKDHAALREFPGQLQPYSVFVPSAYDPARPSGLTLALHSHDQHHWQYNGTPGVRYWGENRNNIVLTCECRGSDGSYRHDVEYEVFEVWNDAARQLNLDPGRVAILGYSA
ncbi:MAG TPA: hypothetical protein VM030_09140, partial [Acidimicrobiales bacterium]|nr:hypothetical protein [Acidimicrobiales bacterium]